MMLRYSVLFFIGVLVLCRCAVPAAPLGGPADSTPPVLDTLRSTPNYLTDVQMRKIILEFDEFVQVSNVSKELIVSPPLRYGPKVETDGKKVIFELDDREELSDSTTYVIQFGESIQDFREGNPYKDYKHIFSTGPVLDSGVIQGKLTDYITGEPIEDALVAIYESNQDTTPMAATPLYYTRSDESGDYTLNYLRQREYALFAIVDLNRNIKYDKGIGESIGFLDNMIRVIQDSSISQNIVLTTPALDLTITEMSGSDKYIKINSSRDIDSLDFIFNPPTPFVSIKPITEKTADFREYFLSNTIDNIISVYPNGDQDTSSAPKGELVSLNLTEPKTGRPVELTLENRLELTWTRPIDSVFVQNIHIQDSTALSVVEGFEIDSLDPRRLYILIKDVREGNQLIELSAGSIQDMYGKRNQDSLSISYSISKTSNYGRLTVSINALDSTMQYLAFLKQKDQIINQWEIADVVLEEQSFDQLIPGEYELVLIEDTNKNNRWDSGTFPGREYPENRKSFSLESVRADWDVESKVVWE